MMHQVIGIDFSELRSTKRTSTSSTCVRLRHAVAVFVQASNSRFISHSKLNIRLSQQMRDKLGKQVMETVGLLKWTAC